MQDEFMYRVVWSTGMGVRRGPRFRYLRDALRYVNDRRGERRSYAIQRPTGDVVYLAPRDSVARYLL